MRELSDDTLVVFVSDTHIGGDPGFDAFESPDELRELFEELAEHDGPVELVLAGDFLDLLSVGTPPAGTNRAEVTISRPEYAGLFAALRGFAAGEGRGVVYLPGNHDHEIWWNPRTRETLEGAGLVDEFAPSYLASFEAGGGRRVVYCEHGNQFDPANRIHDYADPFDTPLGHHLVTDLARRVAPIGEIRRGLDLSQIKNVYPVVEIPHWLVSRFFYDTLGKVVLYLLLPFFVAYALYRGFAYYLAVTRDLAAPFSRGYLQLPRVHELFLDVYLFAVIALAVLALFFLAARRTARRASLAARGGASDRTQAEACHPEIESVARGEKPPPMEPGHVPLGLDVLLTGHTHLPGLSEIGRGDGGWCVIANSGCWLRQLSPVPARFGGPPVFASRFVLTHVRVFAEDGGLQVELWERPRPTAQTLTRTERFFIWGRYPAQPLDGSPRIVASRRIGPPEGAEEG